MTLSKVCLEQNYLDTTRVAMQKVAEYLQPQNSADTIDFSNAKDTQRIRFQAEYFVLRIILASKDDKADVVEHMFTKVRSILSLVDSPISEMAIETMVYLGKTSMQSSELNTAYKWFKRADELVRSTAHQLIGSKLQQCIFQGLIKSLAQIKSDESIQEAHRIFVFAQKEFGDADIMLEWQLDMLEHSNEASAVMVHEQILDRLVKRADPTNDSLRTIFYHIDQISGKDVSRACILLDKLLADARLQTAVPEWFEMALITRLKYVTESDIATQKLRHLENVFSHLPHNLVLSHNGAQAIHALIWKQVKQHCSKGDYTGAKPWCQMGLGDLLSAASDENKAVLGRKLMACDIELGNFEEAQNHFQDLPEAEKSNLLSRYLLFRIALKAWDSNLGCESIGHLLQHDDKENIRNVLYACVKEAHGSGDKICTLAALKAVAKTWENEDVVPASLPSILRCIIRLLFLIESQHEPEAEQSKAFAKDIIESFEQAAAFVKKGVRDEARQIVFAVPELDWFRKNSYNTGVSSLDSWDPGSLVSIFQSSLLFIAAYPPELLGTDERTEADLMSARCHFVSAVTLTSQARKTSDSNLYNTSRSHIESYQFIIPGILDAVDENARADLLSKLATLSLLDFEAVIKLEQFDNLQQIIEDARKCRDVTIFKGMGDYILRSQAPAQVMFDTMKSLINEIYELERFSSDKLSKYIRCVFQTLLPLDDTLALQMLDHAVQVASETAQVGKSYPSIEVEWLAATAFNHGIDLFMTQQPEPCRVWLLKAIELAAYLDDEGVLKSTLAARYNQLSLQNITGSANKDL